MAVVDFTVLATGKHGDDTTKIIKWEGLTGTDSGSPLESPGFADRSVQVEGTFGGGTVVLEGSIDGVNYRDLTDPQGNALSFTTAKIEAITESVRYIRPRCSVAVTDIDVHLIMRRSIR